jgi:hypothetical protein
MIKGFFNAVRSLYGRVLIGKSSLNFSEWLIGYLG